MMRRLDDDGAPLLVLNKGCGSAKTKKDAATCRTPEEVMAILKVLATGQENLFSGCSSGALLISCSFSAMATIRWRLLLFDECDDDGEMFQTDGDDNDGDNARKISAGNC